MLYFISRSSFILDKNSEDLAIWILGFDDGMVKPSIVTLNVCDSMCLFWNLSLSPREHFQCTWNTALKAANDILYEVLVFQVLGFQVLDFQVLGFQVLVFWVLVFQVLGFRVLSFQVLGFRVLGFQVLGLRS